MAVTEREVYLLSRRRKTRLPGTLRMALSSEEEKKRSRKERHPVHWLCPCVRATCKRLAPAAALAGCEVT